MPTEQLTSILIVDDIQQNADLLEQILRPLGHKLVRAASGPEALECLMGDDFDVVLMDVLMPGMSGFETITRFREARPTVDPAVLYVTAATDERSVHEGYSSGAVDYICKPVDAFTLQRKVAALAELYRKRNDLARSEKALQEYKSMLDSSPDGVMIFDAGGITIRYANDSMLRLLKYSETELAELHPWDVMPDFGGESLRALLAKFEEGSPPTGALESCVRCKSGDVVPVDSSFQIVETAGNPSRLAVIVRDLSMRPQTQSARSHELARERHIANSLQRSNLNGIPENEFEGLSVATLYRAAYGDSSGSDFYDAFVLDGTKTAFVLGDFAGLGLATWPSITEVKFSLREFLRESSDLGEALERLNNKLCDSHRGKGPEYMLSGCLGVAIIDSATGDAQFATAGFADPVVFGANGQTRRIACSGLPLGNVPRTAYDSVNLLLLQRDVVVFVTDGITGARNGSTLFGMEGVLKLAESCHIGSPVRHMGQALLKSAEEHAEGILQDEACILLVRLDDLQDLGRANPVRTASVQVGGAMQ